jgi:large subunit ribosomal protein L30
MKNLSKLSITQIGSPIRRNKLQGQVLRGLGLNKMHRTVFLEDTDSIRGMIRVVAHLLRVENVPTK